MANKRDYQSHIGAVLDYAAEFLVLIVVVLVALTYKNLGSSSQIEVAIPSTLLFLSLIICVISIVVKKRITDLENQIKSEVSNLNTQIASSISGLKDQITDGINSFSEHKLLVDKILISRNIVCEWYSDFESCADVVSSAKNSIVVMNHYYDRSHKLKYGGSRDSYLKEGIQKAININKNNNGFTYKRIIPIDNLDNFDGSLTENNVDPQVLEHYKHVCSELGSVRGGARFSFIAVQPVPSFPSTLIVDNKYVFFALPVRVSKHEHSEHNYELTGVLKIYDETSKISETFLKLIDSFQFDTKPIDRAL